MQALERTEARGTKFKEVYAVVILVVGTVYAVSYSPVL
jgi:hypothetical protein